MRQSCNMGMESNVHRKIPINSHDRARRPFEIPLFSKYIQIFIGPLIELGSPTGGRTGISISRKRKIPDTAVNIPRAPSGRPRWSPRRLAVNQPGSCSHLSSTESEGAELGRFQPRIGWANTSMWMTQKTKAKSTPTGRASVRPATTD